MMYDDCMGPQHSDLMQYEKMLEDQRQQWEEEWAEEEFNKLKNISMAEQKKYKTKVIRLYRNNRATAENKQPVFNGFLTLDQPLPAGSYKFGLWESEYNGEISYATTRIEEHTPKQGGGGNTSNSSNPPKRASDSQYTEPADDDLPF